MNFFQHLLQRLIAWAEADDPDPFEGFIDCVPEAPQTPFHVVMPGKYRPYVITSHTTLPEAVATLELLAATFAADGWFVYRVTPDLWRLHKRVFGEDLIDRLEIVSGQELAEVTL